MADSLKALTQPMSDTLRDGETLLGGSKAGGKNAALATGAGGLLGAAINARTGKGSGFASELPQARLFWLAVTDERLVFLSPSALSGTPKKVKGELRLDKVSEVSAKKLKLSHRFEFAFTDGSVGAIDVPKAGNPTSLRAALQKALPGKVHDGDEKSSA